MSNGPKTDKMEFDESMGCSHLLRQAPECLSCSSSSWDSRRRRCITGGASLTRSKIGSAFLLFITSSLGLNCPSSSFTSTEAFHHCVQQQRIRQPFKDDEAKLERRIKKFGCILTSTSPFNMPLLSMSSSSNDKDSTSNSINSSSNSNSRPKKRRQKQHKNKQLQIISSHQSAGATRVKKSQVESKSKRNNRSSDTTKLLTSQSQKQQQQSKQSIRKHTEKITINKAIVTSSLKLDAAPIAEMPSHLSVRDNLSRGFDPEAVASRGADTVKQNQYKKQYMTEGEIEQILKDEENVHDHDNLLNEQDSNRPSIGQPSSSASKKILAITTSEVASFSPASDITNSPSSSNNSSTRRRNISVDTDGTMVTSRRVRASVQETGSDTLNSYMKSMTNHALLRHEDEIVLANEIQTQVQWEEIRIELEEKLLRTPTHAEWAEELGLSVPKLRRQLRRSHKAKTAMMEANLRLVVTMARQTMKKQMSAGGNGVSFQDLCQEGMIGLSKACERYNPMKHQFDVSGNGVGGSAIAATGSTGASGVVRFNTFAKWYIRRGILDSLATQSRVIRLPRSTMKRINTIRVAEVQLLGELGHKPTEDEVAQHLNMSVEKVRFYKRSAEDAMSMDRQVNTQTSGSKGSKASTGGTPSREEKELTLGQTLRDASNKTPTDIANQQMLRDDVRRMIMTLKPKEQAVVRMRFGLDDGIPQTHDDIATQFSVTKERIRKIESQALLKLRQPYRNQSVQCYKDDI